MKINFTYEEMTNFLEKHGYIVKKGLESYVTRGYRGEYEIDYRNATLVYKEDKEIGNIESIFEKVYKEKTLNL